MRAFSSIQAQARFNIRSLYLYSFFWMFLVIIPVLVPFFLQQKMSMQQVFLLQACFGLTVLLLEVPSGYLSDLWGRKKTLLLGALFNGLGYTWLSLSESHLDFFIFEILVGIGFSLASGTDLALLYAWIKTTDSRREAGTQVIARHQMAQVLAESIASLLGAALVLWSFQMLLWVQAAVAWIPLVLALQLQEAPYEKLSTNHQDNLKLVLKHLFVNDHLLRLIFINLTLWSLSTFVAVWTFQKYWQEAGISLAWFGLLWAGYNLLVGLVGSQVSRLEKRWGSYPLLYALSLLPILGFVGMALLPGLWGLFIGLSFQISRGLTQVLLREAFNWRVPDSFRATANSLSSLFFRLGFTLLGPLMGWMIDAWSLRTALALMGLGFALLFVGVMLPLIKHLQSTEFGQPDPP